MSQIRCGCGEKLSMPTEYFGRLARCNTCRKPIRCVTVTGDTQAIFTSRLSIESGPERQGEQLFLSGSKPVTVGKSDAVLLRLNSQMVSRHHCTFIPKSDGNWVVEDHHSTNGLFVNANRVESHELQENDLLDIGDYTLRFHRSAEASEILDVPLEEVDELDDGLYKLSDAPPVPIVHRVIPKAAIPTPPQVCPSCQQTLPGSSKICVQCGIDLKTGKSIQISHAVDENRLHENVNSTAMFASWIMPIGIFPIASEAYGKHKPYAMRVIALATVLITVAVWISNFNDPRREFGATENLMLWTGSQPSAALITVAYSRKDPASYTFQEKYSELKDSPAGKTMSRNESLLTTYAQLDPSDQKFGAFHLYQLLTNIFLHGGLIHLAGNMVFFLVFANRINALVGQTIGTAAYLLLGILASTAFYISSSSGPLTPALGASGAIMGMAGMYLVLFPVSRVYMVFWLRLGIFTGFRRITKIFAMRGFWVLLFYIAFDVWATAMHSHDGTAHWAHLGGFIGGIVLAIVLLLTRQIEANGGDILSLLLGRHAWKLLGTPAQRKALA